MKTKTMAVITAVSSLSLGATFAYFLNNGGVPEKRVLVTGPIVSPPKPAAVDVGSMPRFFTNAVKLEWGQLESDDYRKYVANLRAIGCPESTIRDIIVADVNKLFEAREKALLGPAPKFEYWKRQPANVISEDKLKERLQLVKEKRGVLKELLGVDVEDKTPLLPSSPENKLSFLAREKQDQLNELQATYQAKIQALVGNKIRPSKEDIANFNALVLEADAEVAKVLSPQEYEQYQLNTSRTAQMMRATMGDFNMTEEEFRNVFQLKKQFEDKYGIQTGDAEDSQKVMARGEMEKQIRNVMGDPRYADYTHEQSWATSSIQNVAQEFGIPKDTAVKVFDIKPLAQEQAAKIQLDASLSPEQKQLALEAVKQETVLEIGKIIGKDAANAYYRQGSWIKNLAAAPEQVARAR